MQSNHMEGTMYGYYISLTLQWRHNGRDGISKHEPTIDYSTVYSGVDQRNHQSSASLALVRGFHRLPVNSLHIGPLRGQWFYLMTSSCLTNYRMSGSLGLTHWGRATRICVSNLAIIGSDICLSSGRRQAIILTNAEISSQKKWIWWWVQKHKCWNHMLVK